MATLVTDSGRKSPARLAGSAVLACQSDDRLVSLVRSGHERAFETIVDRYRRPLLGFCRRILPESRAEDAVQQTFINAHASLLESDDAVQLKPWLFAIARNASLNMLRQNGWNYQQIPLDFDGVRRPDQVFEQRVELQDTVAAVNELPERQRSALVMREFEGRSYEEIAVALGANDGAVRQLLNRARGTLRNAASAIMPTPLVARFASSPPDGRRIAEVVGGLGAAGVAKAGATALVAGTLVVGAINAPLVGDGKPVRDKPTPSAGKHSSRAKTLAATPAAAARTHPVSTTHARTPEHTSGSSGSVSSGEHHFASRGSDDHSGSRERSRSGDDRRSGSDDGHSGSGTTGSGDTRRSGSDDGTRTGSDDSTSSAPIGSTQSGSGSDDSPSSGSGSGEIDSSQSGSGSDSGTSLGSGTSGSGGTLDPTRATDD